MEEAVGATWYTSKNPVGLPLGIIRADKVVKKYTRLIELVLRKKRVME